MWRGLVTDGLSVDRQRWTSPLHSPALNPHQSNRHVYTTPPRGTLRDIMQMFLFYGQEL